MSGRTSPEQGLLGGWVTTPDKATDGVIATGVVDGKVQVVTVPITTNPADAIPMKPQSKEAPPQSLSR